MTVTRYAVPATAPSTQLVAPVVLQVAGPGCATTVYPLIPEPGSAGAVQLAVIEAMPAVRVGAAGWPGAALGENASALLGADTSPKGPVATTVAVDAVPLVSPSMRQLLALAPVPL